MKTVYTNGAGIFLGVKPESIEEQHMLLNDHPYDDGAVLEVLVEDTAELYVGCVQAQGKDYTRVSNQELFDSSRAAEWNKVRVQRNELLAESDWIDLPNAALSEEKKALWLTYRQELRDMIDEDTNPFAVEWPNKPV